jgi:hypothetical protein
MQLHVPIRRGFHSCKFRQKLESLPPNLRGEYVHSRLAFQTRGTHVFAKKIFFKGDRIALLVACLCDSQGAMFKHQVSKLLVGGVLWVVPPAEDYLKKIFY